MSTKSIPKSIDEATFYTRDGLSARNNSTLRNVPKRYKRVNMLLQKLKSELSNFVRDEDHEEEIKPWILKM